MYTCNMFTQAGWNIHDPSFMATRFLKFRTITETKKFEQSKSIKHTEDNEVNT